MDNGLSLADIAAVTGKDGSGFGNGNGDWLAMIFLFALIFGFGGGAWGGNRNPMPVQQTDAVTQAQLCEAMNFNGLDNTVGRLSDMLNGQNQLIQQGISTIGYENLQNVSALSTQINGVQGQLAQCCCNTQRAIDGVNYNGAMNTAQIVQSQEQNTQKILDAICGNRIADMQNQINQLQLQNAVAGVVRYPTSYAYNAGPSPFCGCGCANI